MGYDTINGFGYMGGWGMAFGGVMMVFWVVALVALVVFTTRWFGRNDESGNAPSAVEILEQRYARGEIETTEYEERLKGLRSAG